MMQAQTTESAAPMAQEPGAPTTAEKVPFWKNKMVILVAVIVLTLVILYFVRKNKKDKGIQIPANPSPDQQQQKREVAPAENKIRLAMRKLWGENAHWWKEYISVAMMVSAEEADGTPAINIISQRLVKNHNDIAGVIGNVFGQEKGTAVSNAFTLYAAQGGEVLASIAAKDAAKGAEADKQWKKTAEDLADAFLKANPKLRGDLLKQNLKRQTEAMLGMTAAKDASATIKAFDGLYNQSMGLADLLSN
jgi:hypothetical protein